MLMKDKIRELRKAKGMTQKQLGDIVGIDRTHVCYWETGRSEPSIFNCIVLADVFNVSLDELCCRDFKGGKQNVN